MNDTGIRVDDKEVIQALARMSFRKMNKAYKTAMKKSLDPILKQTKANLRTSGIRNVSKPYISRKTGKKYKSMISGVKSSVYIGKTEDSFGKVHLLGEFRLKFFEMGTSLRKTRKGYNRGSISPKWFFRSAVNQKGEEAARSLDDNIGDAIMKAWNNKK